MNDLVVFQGGWSGDAKIGKNLVFRASFWGIFGIS
jgi:hypothetical protein